MNKLRKWLVIFLAVFVTLLGIGASTTTVQAKELQNVLTDINLWDVNNGKHLTVDSSGSYRLTKNVAYRFESSFDLSKYDGNLADGDYFTFTIPEPITVDNTSFDLKDKETGVVVGTAVVTSNGEGQGGTVRITLKDLQEYLKKKGGSQIQGVKGTFYTDFKVSQVVDGKTIIYPSTETSKTITHSISVKEQTTPDYTEGIKKENFVKIGGVMQKEHWDSLKLNKSGEYIHNWVLRVNTNQSSYDLITLKDVIPDDSAPMQFIPEKVKVLAGNFNSTLNLTGSTVLEEGKDYTIEYNSAYTSYTLKLLNTASRMAANGKVAAYNVYYSTTSPANGTDVINELSMKGGETDLTTSTERQNTVHRVARSTKITTGGSIQLETGYRITLYKQDAETAVLLNGVEFEITSPSGQKEIVKIEKGGVAQSKVYTAEEVAKGKFTIVEVKAPKGYVLDKTPIEVTVGKDGVIRTVKNTKEKISISVSKAWEDANNQDGKRPDSITVQLLANGQEVAGKTLILNSENKWKATFENLNKYTDQGTEIMYSLKELEVPEGYQSKVTGDMASGFIITNTYPPATTEVSGKKTWDDADNQDGKRPEKLNVKLLKTVGGQTTEVTTKEISSKDDWNYSFSNLPQFENGQAIIYTVDEELPEGYTKTVDGYNLINTYSPEVTEVSGTKTWDDADNQDGKRPEKLNVKLLKTVEGQTTEVTTKEISSKDDWNYSFSNLPQFENGQAITYTVDEELPEGYTKTVDGYNLINTYSPEVTEVSGTKTWDDADNQDGKRPDAITVHLLANGQKVASKIVTATDNWTYSFKNLVKYEAGKLVAYTISEEAVPSYHTTVDGYYLTNSYSPEMIDVTVQKKWEDGDNQDGKRPSEITVYLLANGERVDSQTIQADIDGNWNTTFSNRPKYAKGQLIRYTVEEEAVVEYRTIIEGFTIINSYRPKEINYRITKKWADNGNQDGKRPTSITVSLYKSVAGSEPVAVTGKTLTLTAENQTDTDTWVGSFTNLPQFEKGQEISYSVREDDATMALLAETGYLAKVEGQVITNSRTPEMIRLTGTKVWDDVNNQDGKRPTSIIIVVKDGQGTEVERITVTPDEKGQWSFTSKELPKYANGNEITYSVEEIVTKEYTSTIVANGHSYTVTNSYTPKKISLKGSKIWNDGNDQDGIRPSSITVHLFANGVDTGKTATASEATGWNYSFEGLDQYQNGQVIQYTVQEDAVPGYTTQIDGTLITNSYVPKETPPGTQLDKSTTKRALPATNSTTSLGLIVIGLSLLVGVGIYLMKQRK
ncbi:Cna B-type domain-containing protein [Streptococcus sp. 19428wC2_LYSM12]|uniref:Cna B-type domain-containing protein n=1 Tax=unclassified Streptococcus TaxID=2608887 RepID=UPI001072DF94|nr:MULTISPECIES: Cna B-type domain-containing protein [unclassified Streptococcus]MBF0786751.1 Cna B-type domain-containing protein [Streptococcus sp. 19428wC2_LYSM12]TFV06502.1 Cna B-type domain-containing protein [Streptococcus sp. LYSM12]